MKMTTPGPSVLNQSSWIINSDGLNSFPCASCMLRAANRTRGHNGTERVSTKYRIATVTSHPIHRKLFRLTFTGCCQSSSTEAPNFVTCQHLTFVRGIVLFLHYLEFSFDHHTRMSELRFGSRIRLFFFFSMHIYFNLYFVGYSLGHDAAK